MNTEVLYSIIGISLIFLCTTLGALTVFLFKGRQISPLLNKIFTGFAAGVMFSASFFSLIKPALETNVTYMPSWVVVAISIVLGAMFFGVLINLFLTYTLAKTKMKV